MGKIAQLLKKRPRRVLIVDDEYVVRSVISRFSEKLGLEVCGSVSDGYDAIDFVRRKDVEPDLVLLDVFMRELNGDKALPGIRTCLPGVKVIVMSAYSESHARFPANLGADDFLQKPFSFARFATAVQGLFPDIRVPDF